MVDYLYDGAFEGLLSCIFAHYYEEKASGIFPRVGYQATMLGNFREIETDTEKAGKVYDAIEKKISTHDLARIYRAFLSSVCGKETKILKYVTLGFKEGAGISLLHGNPVVFDLQQIEKKVTGEAHRLCGLIRFSALAGEILYAPIEPDHDVVELLAEHFCDRFKNEAFVIHDKTRAKALLAKGGNWYISAFDADQMPALSAGEEEYRRLWQKYFNTIAIRERANPRCQKNFMPTRYWKNLTEMQPQEGG